jgi:hypothetical protein
MEHNKGKSYVTCYHPTIDEEWCEIRVSWTHEYDSGDRDNPPYEDVEIEETILITYNDKHVSRKTPIPDWVTLDELRDGINLDDVYDRHDN